MTHIQNELMLILIHNGTYTLQRHSNSLIHFITHQKFEFTKTIFLLGSIALRRHFLLDLQKTIFVPELRTSGFLESRLQSSKRETVET